MATKNAIAKAWSITPSNDGRRWSAYPAGDRVAPTGLDQPGNGNNNGSNIAIVFSGANLPPRTSLTALWKANLRQQTGFYNEFVISHNNGSFAGDFFEVMMNAHPCDGTFDSNGQRLVPTSSAGTVHYYALSGLGAQDQIASPAALGTQVATLAVKGIWVSRMFTVEVVNLSGTPTARHTFWPDLSAPDVFIQRDVAVSAIAAAGATPAAYWGASDWTPSGTGNNETFNALVRGYKLFNAPLNVTDGQAESDSPSDAGVTPAGIASLWYSNQNPTPTDITDKSGKGHNPAWRNANRPTLWAG